MDALLIRPFRLVHQDKPQVKLCGLHIHMHYGVTLVIWIIKASVILQLATTLNQSLLATKTMVADLWAIILVARRLLVQ